jgi:chitodextrinase
MMRFFVFCLMIVAIPLSLRAAAPGDAFIVRQLIGDDSAAPTTPLWGTATPITSAQIDLSWLPSSDDIAVVAYRVYRDGIVIATTTQTSYSDSGLAASTTYTYTLDAYDHSFNISSTSAPLSTTTLALPVPVPPATTTPSATGATAVPFARTLTVSTTPTTATIHLSTYGPTSYVVRWGRTTSYELGAISSGLFRRNHAPTLYQLEPGTVYQYELELINERGIRQVVEHGSFTTQPSYVSTVPGNVSNLRATVVQTDVQLSWQLPPALEGTVRVVRSHLFYPTSPTDGVIVYEGVGDGVTDSAAFGEHSPLYYTVFVQHPSGLVSSGAVVRVDRPADFVIRDDALPTQVVPEQSSTTTAVPGTPIVPVGGLQLLDPASVQLRYDGLVTTFDALYELPTGTEVTILVPQAAVMPHLKAIMLTVYNPSQHTETTSYLLKLDQAGTYYAVTFTTADSEGEAAIMLEVYDFTAAVVRRIGTQVTYQDTPQAVAVVQKYYYDATFIGGVGGVGFLAASGGWLLWRRRRREDKK